MLVDSHCHLDFEQFQEEGVDAVINRAKQAGVGHMLTLCCRIAEFQEKILPRAEQHPELDCTIGTHPHQAEEEFEISVTEKQLIELANNPHVVGIGETGLDYHYDNSPHDIQQQSLRKHIRVAKELNLPLIIHNRESDDDMISILREEAADKGVLHCFSSSPQLAENALEIGFYISFSGILTFKNADDLREVAKNTPMDRILVETDAPFLAPVPMRGKTNEPAYVAHTAAFLAELKGISLEELTAQTTDNFYRLFDRAERRD